MYESVTERFVDPTVVVTHFHLHEGDVVADFGAGSGGFMKPLSGLVGKGGVVYMCEVQKQLVDALGVQAQGMPFRNVRAIWGDIEVLGGTKIRDASLDAVVVSNTLFQVEDKNGLFAEIARVLRNGGKLFVIEWSESFSGIGPHRDQVVTETETKMYAEKAGFTYERSFPAGEHHYGIAFRK